MKKQFHALTSRVAGLTLIELLVSVAIIGIISAVALPSMSELLERQRVVAAAEEVTSVLNYAKAETNSVNSLLIVRFDPDPNMSCALVATSAGFNKCRCNNPVTNLCPGTTQKPLRLFQLPKTHVKFEAAATSWAGSPNNIRFMRDQMTMATEGFHVDVVGLGKGYTLRVEVNAIGRVKICAPAAPAAANVPYKKMSGYGECV